MGFGKEKANCCAESFPGWKYKSRTTSNATFVFCSIFHAKYVPKPLLELKDTIRGKLI